MLVHLAAFYLYLVSYSLFYIQILLKLNIVVFNILSETCVLTSIISQVCLIFVLYNIYRATIMKLAKVTKQEEPEQAITLQNESLVDAISSSSLNELPDNRSVFQSEVEVEEAEFETGHNVVLRRLTQIRYN